MKETPDADGDRASRRERAGGAGASPASIWFPSQRHVSTSSTSSRTRTRPSRSGDGWGVREDERSTRLADTSIASGMTHAINDVASSIVRYHGAAPSLASAKSA